MAVNAIKPIVLIPFRAAGTLLYIRKTHINLTLVMAIVLIEQVTNILRACVFCCYAPGRSQRTRNIQEKKLDVTFT